MNLEHFMIGMETISPQGTGVIITAIFGGIASVAAAIYGKKKGVEEGSQKVEIRPNPLPVSMVDKLATKAQLEEVEEKLEGRILRVENAAAEDRRILRQMESKTHERIDKVAEKLSAVDGMVHKMDKVLDQVLSLLLNRKGAGE